VEAADEADEAEWIAGEVRSRLSAEPTRTPRDFVVLYRTNAQSRALEEAFRREAIRTASSAVSGSTSAGR
jgi:DNA helicase II / ATP-dependent DNA helicase PcrA